MMSLCIRETLWWSLCLELVTFRIVFFRLCLLCTVSVLQPIGVKLSLEEAIDLVKDTFASAAERDIYTVSAWC